MEGRLVRGSPSSSWKRYDDRGNSGQGEVEQSNVVVHQWNGCAYCEGADVEVIWIRGAYSNNHERGGPLYSSEA